MLKTMVSHKSLIVRVMGVANRVIVMTVLHKINILSKMNMCVIKLVQKDASTDNLIRLQIEVLPHGGEGIGPPVVKRDLIRVEDLQPEAIFNVHNVAGIPIEHHELLQPQILGLQLHQET